MSFFFAFIITIYKQKCEIMITNFFKNLWNKLFPKKVQTIETSTTWTPSLEIQAYINSSVEPSSPISTPEPIASIEPQSLTIEISDVTVVGDSFEEHDNTEKIEVIHVTPLKKRTYTKRAPVKKAPLKMTLTKKTAAKKSSTKKAANKKTSVKKVAIKKVVPKKTTTKKIIKKKK